MDVALTLDFPRKAAGLEGAIARFEEWMANPDSPVRAIRRIPERTGDFVEFPEALAPVLRQALVSRGIRQLYTHQAAAFEHAANGRNRGGGDANGQRQDAVLQPSGAESAD